MSGREAEVILEEAVAALGTGSMGIYCLPGEESKEEMRCPLNRCQPLNKMGPDRGSTEAPPYAFFTSDFVGKNERRKGGND